MQMHILSVVDEFFLLKWSVRTRVRLSGLVLLTSWFWYWPINCFSRTADEIKLKLSIVYTSGVASILLWRHRSIVRPAVDIVMVD